MSVKGTQEKAPKSVRTVEIVVGAITLVLAGLVLAFPLFAVLFIVFWLSLSLIFGGLEGIIIGASARHLSRGWRADFDIPARSGTACSRKRSDCAGHIRQACVRMGEGDADRDRRDNRRPCHDDTGIPDIRGGASVRHSRNCPDNKRNRLHHSWSDRQQVYPDNPREFCRRQEDNGSLMQRKKQQQQQQRHLPFIFPLRARV